MPRLSEIPWQPARPKRRWAPWVIVIAAGFMVLALFSGGVLPEPEVPSEPVSGGLAKAVTSTEKIDRIVPAPMASPSAKQEAAPRAPSSQRPAGEPSTYEGLRRELLDKR